MRGLRRRSWTGALLLLLMALGTASAAQAQGDTERLRTAKALFFDRKYAEARQTWQQILATSRGADADVAAFWVARCSENLDEHERAFKEYEMLLARRPADRTLVEEARTGRVRLATRLYKAGRTSYLKFLTEALSDPSKTVRYYTALQLSSLPPEVGRPAVPVLQSIVEHETDEDLVNRAKLGLLRLDPSALSHSSSSPRDVAGPRSLADTPTKGEGGRWIGVRIYASGESRPHVSLNLPLALADLVFKSLPEDAKRELREEGYDADNFWEKVRTLRPGLILDIEGSRGERIQIWIK